jgi:hypothetical protein
LIGVDRWIWATVTILANFSQRLLLAQQASAGRAGKLAMSASIIGPAAAGHRHQFRAHSIRALRLLPAVVLSLCNPALAAEEAPGRLALEKDSFYLKSAGFQIQFANDPAGQKALRALPPHRFVTKGGGDALRYFYAEPQHCVCIFVGTQQAYDNYRNIQSQPLRSAHAVPPDYKTQSGMLLSNQPPRPSTRGDPTTLSDYLRSMDSRY